MRGTSTSGSYRDENPEQKKQAEDVMLFKTSLLARRFPGLKNLSDEDILQLVAADGQAQRRRAEDPRMNRTFPKTFYPIPQQKKRETTVPSHQQPPPFRPISAPQAREQASRSNQERFLNCQTPFESDRQCFLTDRATDRSKEFQPPFSPICPSQAQEAIKVDYFLYSPKHHEKQAEREAISQRGTANREQLRELLASRRGRTLV